MLNSLLSFFTKKPSDDTMKLTKAGVKEGVYRDELSKKPISNYSQKMNCSYSENSEPLLSKRDENDVKGVVVMRVKVKMTRQEAARLLSRCKNGGVLEFKDVVNELSEIPVNRVTLDQSPRTSSTAGPVEFKDVVNELSEIPVNRVTLDQPLVLAVLQVQF